VNPRFDVIEVARGRYVPQAYRNFIGFEVSKPVLERAFLKTYGTPLTDQFANLDLSIGTFRRAVSSTIPGMTKIAWETKRDEIERMTPGLTRDQFMLTLTRAEYEQQWGRQYQRPNLWHKTLAALLRVMPRVGPFKVLAFRPPTPQTERLFLDSVNQTLNRVRSLLSDLSGDRLRLENVNLDTGRRVQAGEYRLADQSYARLLHGLAKRQFAGLTPALRANIVAYFGTLQAPIAAKAHRQEWTDLQHELTLLQRLPRRP